MKQLAEPGWLSIIMVSTWWGLHGCWTPDVVAAARFRAKTFINPTLSAWAGEPFSGQVRECGDLRPGRFKWSGYYDGAAPPMARSCAG